MLTQKEIDAGTYWSEGVTLVSGCTKVSEGCMHCWAEVIERRFHIHDGAADERGWTGKVRFRANRLDRFRTQRRTVFALWNDPFHPSVPSHAWSRLYHAMHTSDGNVFLLLTKRSAIMLDMVTRTRREAYPLANVWLGISVENQQRADERISPLLELATKGWNTYINCEPLLGPVDLSASLWRECPDCDGSGSLGKVVHPGFAYPQGSVGREATCETCDGTSDRLGTGRIRHEDGIGAVIAGAETGPCARPADLDWFRQLRDQCADAGVPFFLKQVDAKRRRVLDGRTHDDLPWNQRAE